MTFNAYHQFKATVKRWEEVSQEATEMCFYDVTTQIDFALCCSTDPEMEVTIYFSTTNSQWLESMGVEEVE